MLHTARRKSRPAASGVPVQVHLSTSNRGGVEQLLDFLALAERVPRARYVLAHAVGMPDHPPVVDTYLNILEDRYHRWPDNFWMEIRDFNSPGVKSALRRVPNTRLLAGTDWTSRVGPPFLPYGMIFGFKRPEDNPYPPSVSRMAEFLLEAGASEDRIHQIGFANAASLFSLS